MRWTRHSFATLFMVLVLAATSGAMAVARGKARTATGSIVLCTGTGPVSVAVDARGQPTGKLRFCPDCALSLFNAAAVSAHLPAPVHAFRRIAFPPRAMAGISRSLPPARARAPPAA